MSRPGIEPVTSRSPEWTPYQLTYRGWWQSKGEHERICAMKRRLGLGRISPPVIILRSVVYHTVMLPKDSECRPRSDCSIRSSLIWVGTVCPDLLSVLMLRIITVGSPYPVWIQDISIFNYGCIVLLLAVHCDHYLSIVTHKGFKPMARTR